MYNTEIKYRFLNSLTGEKAKTSYKSFFTALSKFEEQFGKDLADFSLGEVCRAINDSLITEYATASGYLYYGRRYTEWCISTNAFGRDIIGGFQKASDDDIDLTDAVGKILFKNLDDLIDSIRIVESLDDGYIEPVVYMLAWMGLQRDEIVALQDSQVDLNRRIIYGTDGRVLVSTFCDEIYDVFCRYQNCKESTRLKGRTEQPVFQDRSTGFFLKKMLSRGSKFISTPYTKGQIDVQLNRFASVYEGKGYPRRHTFMNVWRSGRFYEMWQIDNSGIDVLATGNKSIVMKIFPNKTYYDVKHMYKFYKKAFYSGGN